MHGTLLAEKITNAIQNVMGFKTGPWKKENQFVFDGSF
jgi:hypothetical protein